MYHVSAGPEDDVVHRQVFALSPQPAMNLGLQESDALAVAPLSSWWHVVREPVVGSLTAAAEHRRTAEADQGERSRLGDHGGEQLEVF